MLQHLPWCYFSLITLENFHRQRLNVISAEATLFRQLPDDGLGEFNGGHKLVTQFHVRLGECLGKNPRSNFRPACSLSVADLEVVTRTQCREKLDNASVLFHGDRQLSY